MGGQNNMPAQRRITPITILNNKFKKFWQYMMSNREVENGPTVSSRATTPMSDDK